MIVKMSKIELAGPKELLLEVLAILRELGILQIDPAIRTLAETTGIGRVKPHSPDEKRVAEWLFLENLLRKVNELFSFLPPLPVRKSYLEPSSAVDAISAVIDRHLALCGELRRKKEELRREREELTRYGVIFDSLESLLKGVSGETRLDFLGVTLNDEKALEVLKGLLSRVTDGKFEMMASRADDGSLVVLIALAGDLSERVRRALSQEQMPELNFPSILKGLPFPEKLRYLRQRQASIAAEDAGLDGEMARFAQRWSAHYQLLREWLESRLSLLRATTTVYETGMCFFICGWLASAEVAGLAAELNSRFKGRVVVEEKRIVEQELEMVPVALKNPPYFRPFELLIRLPPPPRYTSYDPTPYIALFFPIFFGMMLGDAGHGLVVLLGSLLVMRIFRGRKNITDAAKIASISSLYAIVFGIIFGEFFGEFGAELLGMSHIGVERRETIMPMLLFALGVGVMHVLLGLLLGLSLSIRKRTVKEAALKLLNIFIILCLVTLAVSLLQGAQQLIRPIVVTLLVTIPLLVLTGGLLAPLELVKNLGNIVSYVRIMAIGLTSVYLASVANRLAGLTGDIVSGTIVAVILHAFNIVIGVFAPTVHALRLHYVEFFSKFLEHGGRRFEPFGK